MGRVSDITARARCRARAATRQSAANRIDPVAPVSRPVARSWQPSHRLRVGIVGGNGFIGQHVARAIIEAGAEAFVFGRSMEPDAHVEGADYVCVSFDALHPKEEQLQGLHVVVNLVGIKMDTGRQSFEDAHVKAVTALTEAALRARVFRFVHISVAGARRDEDSQYLSTKAAGEDAVRASRLAEFATIIRTGVVYGDGDDVITNLASRSRTARPGLR